MTTTHTPTPFTVEWREDGGYDANSAAFAIVGSDGREIATIDVADYMTEYSTTYEKRHERFPQAEVDALFLCRAANAHDGLVTALQRLLHDMRFMREEYSDADDAADAAIAVLRDAGIEVTP